MKNLKYLIIILALVSIVVGSCKHKLNDGMIHITGKVIEDGSGAGIEGANVYLVSTDYGSGVPIMHTECKVQSGQDGSYQINANANDGFDYSVQARKNGYDYDELKDLKVGERVLNQTNLKLFPYGYLQIHFKCVSTDKIHGTFYSSNITSALYDLDYKNNTDTVFGCKLKSNSAYKFTAGMRISRQGGAYIYSQYPFDFFIPSKDTSKVDITIN